MHAFRICAVLAGCLLIAALWTANAGAEEYASGWKITVTGYQNPGSSGGITITVKPEGGNATSVPCTWDAGTSPNDIAEAIKECLEDSLSLNYNISRTPGTSVVKITKKRPGNANFSVELSDQIGSGPSFAVEQLPSAVPVEPLPEEPVEP